MKYGSVFLFARSRFPAAVMMLLVLLACLQARAQQQYQGFCAAAKIEILQELTMERIGFLATLEVTNNDAVDAITGFNASLRFTRPQGGGVEDDATDLFWVRQPELININGIDGDGNIAPGAKATVKWFIVPKPGAGGEAPEGIRYFVHCDLAGDMRGEIIPKNVMFAIPDMITVRPEPELEITYFQPQDVQGDDPFTEQVEAPVPFTLGVLVKNVGYGTARNVVIRSEQPRIVENVQQLLLIAQLIGCRVMDEPLDRTSLTVNIGDILPQQARVAAWDMITSLSGTFTEFKATYTHAPEFGGEETSLIRSMNAHFIVREVLNDMVGRDRVRDFLANTERHPDQLPDTLYESEGHILPVHIAQDTALARESGNTYTFTATAVNSGATYLRTADPGQNRRRIAEVRRADGTLVNSNNYWTSTRYLKEGNTRLDEAHLFDIVPAGELVYTLTYAADLVDVDPPVTSIEFSGRHTLHGGIHYIDRETQIYFLSEDESPVSISYKPSPDAGWQPAYPFRLLPGSHEITYRAIDDAMNEEEPKTAHIEVLDPAEDGTALALDSDRTGLSLLAELASARPGEIRFEFSAPEGPLPRTAEIEIFRGIRAWPRLHGIPASPVRPGTITMAVSGDAVDLYRWRLNEGAWSGEIPAATALVVDCTEEGEYQLEVLARHEQGVFPPDAAALRTQWTVAGDAPPVRLLDAPPWPSSARSVEFGVGGDGVETYRWSLDAGYIRPSAPVASPFVVSNLTDAAYEVRIFPNLPDGTHTEEGYAAYVWSNELDYGHDCSMLQRVRRSEVGLMDGLTVFVWDGRNDEGIQVYPGWYTVRVSAGNALGQVIWTKHYVQVEEIGGEDMEVASASRGVDRMHGRGDWVVWTDRSGGQWQIWARDVANGGEPFAVTAAAATQDAPCTDGRYVVWQGRQEDSTWAIYIADLTRMEDGIGIISAQPNIDDVNPSIDWPWVVWQSRDVRAAGSPYQLIAHNLVTGEQRPVSPSTQDQLDPVVDADRVVWQDWRDVGPGEIYFQDLETGEERRITTSPAGQYRPSISGSMIVWQDNRHGQLDLYAYDLRDGREIRLTDTPYDESSPVVRGEWVFFAENALDPAIDNLRLMHLASLRTAPMTRSATRKRFPALLTRHSAWLDMTGSGSRVVAGALPSIRGIYAERNAVPVTAQMLETASTAFDLLDRWRDDANVIEVAMYEQLWPEVVMKRAWRDSEGGLQGEDFSLNIGMFVWLGFDRAQLIDFGPAESGSLDLPEGASVLTYTGFPVGYSAFRMVRQIGIEKVRALRLHDPASGRWLTLQTEGGQLIGEDFPVPRIAVLLIDMREAIGGWTPQ